MIQSFIITGFLGVGKSSMLTNTVKNHFQDKNIALIVNEFGEVGVDQNILKNVHSDVIEISEGCICCTMAQEFESGVIEIIGKYNPDIIFVETSGAAEPFPVFMSLQNLGISVEGVICVVDAKNYDSYMHNATAKYQVGGSNIIVLNKSDLVNDEALAQAQKDITAIKEEHDIKNTMTGKKVFNNYFLHTAQQGILGKEVFEGVYEIDEIIGLSKDYHQHSHEEHDKFEQKVSHISGEILFEQLDDLIKSLPENIYRLKGIVKTEDVPTPLVVNYSFGNVSFEELQDYDEESVLVFIGEDIESDIKTLKNTFSFLKFIGHAHSHEHHHHHDHDHHEHHHHHDHDHHTHS
ncbi:MAG: Putative metal chaperone, involved in Zn homeostasis, GTPase of COG0523 family [uncultured Sulfurovum sp.]|uniref:Metal chaperone, involved in Zn homeostasis, GTPase of COG0523 family n=1 Tax=uncultured Sulfurovum sp. TaxID=269237 RepID=A0A6S6SIR0_9BACT|nr:MAG: Putative metal chaperone, involved in Zn homeostasis, GTPase of COG0523 family [uncultured Sulfurovum sp.]